MNEGCKERVVRMKGLAAKSLDRRQNSILLAETDLGQMPEKLASIMSRADELDEQFIEDADKFLTGGN